MTKTLHELRTTGFNKLRNGHIHLRCPDCGRKQSNAPRAKHDPLLAVLMEVLCEKCGAGCKDFAPSYYDEDGQRCYQCRV